MNKREYIGNMIAGIRQSKGLSILQLSKMTGIDNSNLGKIEKGKTNVCIDNLLKICDALECSLDIKSNNK